MMFPSPLGRQVDGDHLLKTTEIARFGLLESFVRHFDPLWRVLQQIKQVMPVVFERYKEKLLRVNTNISETQ